MKDYYQILGVKPSDNLAEIKKAYRKLAHQFHPDKNNTDPYAAAHFAEIKQAYEVLTNPAKKEYYLEQRWYEQSLGRKKASPIITPESVLKQAIEFDRHVSRLDIHRLNKWGLFQYICEELLPAEVIEKLNAFDDKDINKEIIGLILKNLHAIPAGELSTLENLLLKVNGEKEIKLSITKAIRNAKKEHRIEKYKVVILVAVVLAITMIIYFFGG